MFFVLVLIFLGFIVLTNIYGDQKPILYLAMVIFLLIIATIDFTLSGHDWLNNIWGSIMLLCAIGWLNRYLRFTHQY
jgi:hypothetical protein